MKKLACLLLLSAYCSVQAHIPAWTTDSAAASTATAGFYVTGSAQTTVTEQQASSTNQTYQAANFNIGGSANINAAQNFNLIGSNLNVNDTLNLNADQINLIAGVTQNTSSSSDKTTSEGGSISTSAGGSFSANARP